MPDIGGWAVGEVIYDEFTGEEIGRVVEVMVMPAFRAVMTWPTVGDGAVFDGPWMPDPFAELPWRGYARSAA